jgi:hypothetical protein
MTTNYELISNVYSEHKTEMKMSAFTCLNKTHLIAWFRRIFLSFKVMHSQQYVSGTISHSTNVSDRYHKKIMSHITSML